MENRQLSIKTITTNLAQTYLHLVQRPRPAITLPELLPQMTAAKLGQYLNFALLNNVRLTIQLANDDYGDQRWELTGKLHQTNSGNLALISSRTNISRLIAPEQLRNIRLA